MRINKVRGGASLNGGVPSILRLNIHADTMVRPEVATTAD